MKITIKARFTDSILFEGEYEYTRHAVEAAVKRGANLRGANLEGAYLGEKLKFVGKSPVLCIGPIGSRESYLTAYNTESGIHVKTGCFFGTLAEFKARVKDTHKTGRFAAEYKAAISMISATFKARS